MQLLLMPNLDKPNAYACVNRLTRVRFSRPVTFLMDERLKEGFPGCGPVEWGPFESLIARCDACIAIGGDGTIIHSGKSAARHRKPVLGINLGRNTVLDVAYQNVTEKQTPYELFFSKYQDGGAMKTYSGLYDTNPTRHYLSMTLGFRF